MVAAEPEDKTLLKRISLYAPTFSSLRVQVGAPNRAWKLLTTFPVALLSVKVI